jgi:hypothetical protein
MQRLAVSQESKLYSLSNEHSEIRVAKIENGITTGTLGVIEKENL